MKVVQKILVLLIASFVLVSCSDSPTSPDKNIGERAEYQSVDSLNVYNSDVAYYKMVYNSVDPAGNIVKASGAIFVPSSTTPAPLFSLQHGTVFSRTNVASQLGMYSAEGPVAVAFASAGYVVIVPDYLGYGVSTEMHPYVHKDGTAKPVVDMIRAAKTWCADQGIALDGDLFLGGYSEGGYVTMATQMLIESEYDTELPITASAPAAGPFDLLGFVDIVLNEMSYPDLGNVSFILTAYNDIYDWNMMSDMFQAPYDAQLQEMLDGSMTSEEIAATLPDTLPDLLAPQFVQDVQSDAVPEFSAAFEENSLLDWTPHSPIHLYHGTADKRVAYENSVAAYDTLNPRSTSTVEFTSYEGLGHLESALQVYYDMAGWFETYR